MLQQSGSSGLERQAKLDEWRRNWAPAPTVVTKASAVDRSPATVGVAASAALVERSAWTVVQMPFLAPPNSADDADGSINRVSAMKAYEETNG
ncbi:MAG: hypothetical protein ABW179_03210 [Methylobacterium sp.]